MKRIKSFKIFESGVRYSDYRDIAIDISNLLTSDQFMPHTEQTSHWTDLERKFKINTTCENSKWGLMYDITFNLDEPINLNVVNDPIKHSFLNVIDYFLDYYQQSKVTLTKFSYWGENVAGQKNGHTKEIEDVQEKAIEIIERLGNSDKMYFGYAPISFQIIVK